ncbi:MAG: substrate-binding domain-containing protein [Pirellulaceae bacterium]|nr:substrate-binding domain-containing protein [Pirellulaceae bacterium]
MNRTTIAMLGSLALLVAAMVLLSQSNQRSVNQTEPIVLFCAASNRAVVDAVREDYKQEYGRDVQVQYGPSQTLLATMEVTQTGDLYLPADDSFLKLAKEKNLVAETLPLGMMKAGVAVPKGNPKHINALADLLKDDVRFVQASVEASAIGKLTRELLTRSQRWDALDKATDAYRSTVTDVANDVLVGAADAGIVYDAVLHTYPGLEFVSIPELAGAQSQIVVGVVSESKQPAAALHFARYLAAADRGGKRYEEFGFAAEKSEVWSDVPELAVFAGSMLRPAIEETIKAFEQREGVRVTTVYNGCGILVAQMKTGLLPDAYFACDKEFMSQVKEYFPDPVDVSQNELVILVKKGNPLGIRSLKDLTREGLRVGIGHEKQCAMGWITQNTFREGGIQKEVMANVTVQTPTGDMLVNQLRTGSLDAAVAYLSNAAGAAEFLDAIQITGIECSVAIQPWAIAAKSKYPLTTSRLFERICSAESQEVFLAEGFRWQKN